MNSKSKGKLVLYTGSSGVGKGTIMAELLKRNPNIRLSVSNTQENLEKVKLTECIIILLLRNSLKNL